MIKAIYADTFDPLTPLHTDIIKRSIKLCDQLVIAIDCNIEGPLSRQQRMQQISKMVVKEIEFLTSVNVKVVCFTGLLVDFANEIGANILIKEINIKLFDYETDLADFNKRNSPHIETVFLASDPEILLQHELEMERFYKSQSPYNSNPPKNIIANFFRRICGK
jgi:pantetheine-phosphate adenylyltransferase